MWHGSIQCHELYKFYTYLHIFLLIMMVSLHMRECSPNKTLSRGFRLNFIGIYNICKLGLIFCNELNGNLKFRVKSTSVMPVTQEEIYSRIRERNSRDPFKEIILTKSWKD
jgi:hypothetical protein